MQSYLDKTYWPLSPLPPSSPLEVFACDAPVLAVAAALHFRGWQALEDWTLPWKLPPEYLYRRVFQSPNTGC